MELNPVEERTLEKPQDVRARRTDKGIRISVLDTPRETLKPHTGIEEYRRSTPSHHRDAQREKVSARGHQHKHSVTRNETEVAQSTLVLIDELREVTVRCVGVV